jgi:hypothetical protein
VNPKIEKEILDEFEEVLWQIQIEKAGRAKRRYMKRRDYTGDECRLDEVDARERSWGGSSKYSDNAGQQSEQDIRVNDEAGFVIVPGYGQLGIK